MSLRLKQILLLSSAVACVPGSAFAQAGSSPAVPPTGTVTSQGDASPAVVADPMAGAASTPVAGPSPAASPPAQSGVQDIVVTATRRSENLQKVPVNVTAVQASTLNALKITDTSGLQQLAPGLTIVRGGGIVPFIRGVGTATSGFTTEIPVAVYLDGIYQPNASTGLFSFNNIERIEVLKGPQGTLYGRNSTGGLINVVTRDPGSHPELDASASYGNYESSDFKFYGSTPLTSNLFFNLAASYSNQGDGYARNLFTGDDVMKTRSGGTQAKLLWKPGSDTVIELRGFYNYNKSDLGLAFMLLPGTVAADGTRPAGDYKTDTRRDPYSVLNQYNINLKVEQNLGFAKLTSLTSYSHARQPLRYTQSGNPGQPIVGQAATNVNQIGSDRTITQELQLTSNNNGSPFQWVAGAYYFNDNTRVENDVYGTCVGTVCAGPLPTSLVAFPKTRSYSGYGEVTYDVTPTTHVTGGLRYTSDLKTISGTTTPLQGQPNTPAGLPTTTVISPGDSYPGNPDGIDTSSTFNKLTYRAVVAQDVTPDIHAYASYNRGFKSGTYNVTVFSNPVSKPETLDAIAAGLKSELFDHLLRVNVEGFYYNYKDIQLRSTAPPAPPGGAILVNAAKARSTGVDLDAVIAPMRGLTINGDVEYLDAHYKSFPGGTCVRQLVVGGTVIGGAVAAPCDLSGARLLQSPKISFDLGFTYKIDTTIGEFALVGSESHKSSYNQVPDGVVMTKAYDIVNASLTWTPTSRSYYVQIFGKNLSKAYYITGGSEAVAGNDVYTAGAPRTYGVEIGVHF